jgi:hypothetical protein
MIYLLINYLLQHNVVYYHIGNNGIDVGEYSIPMGDLERWNNIYRVM